MTGSSMRTLRHVRRPLCYVSMAAFATAVAPVPAAQAAMVDTNTMVSQNQRADARAKVTNFMSRADVRAQMERLGVPSAEAQARINSMSDAELQKIAGHLDTMPAGEGILALALVVIIILGLLDLFGVIG